MLVVIFLSQSGCDMWPTVSLTLHVSREAAWTWVVSSAEQTPLESDQPVLYLQSSTDSLRPTSPRLVWSEWKACVSGRSPQRSLILPGRAADQVKSKTIKSRSTQHLSRAKGMAEHVYCTKTAGEVYPIQPQLARTKRRLTGGCCSCHCCTAGVRRHDHFPKKLIWTGRCSNHQSDSDTRPVPNYSYWVPRKRTPNLDKWTFFPGINTNSLTSIGASRHWIPETYFSAISLAFTPLFSPLLTATHYIYSHSLSVFIMPVLILSSESI